MKLFLSYSKTDRSLLIVLKALLEAKGVETWAYEADGAPGPSYLLQVYEQIKAADAFLVVLSEQSLKSEQVGRELIRAFEEHVPILPLLLDVDYERLSTERPEWRTAMGAANALAVSIETLGDCLPRILKGLDMLAGRTAAPPTEALDRKVRVLHIEDDRHLLTTMREFLSHKGFDVTTAESGEKALAVLRQCHPDIVLLDISMPGIGGIGFLKAYDTHWDAPVVVLTARANMGDFFSSFGGAVRRFITKPCYEADLFEALKEFGIHRSRFDRDSKTACPEPGPSTSVDHPETSPKRTVNTKVDVPESIRAFDVEFTNDARQAIAALGLTEEGVLDLMDTEFKSHANYFRFDLDDYPLPLRTHHIVYMSKSGTQLQILNLMRCTANEAKLTSWADLLTLYRQSTRLAYRTDPNALIRIKSLPRQALSLHAELRQRMLRHYERFDDIKIDLHFLDSVVPDAGDAGDLTSNTAGIRFHIHSSIAAERELQRTLELVESGALTVDDSIPMLVTALERSLQHLHKILLAYPPVPASE